MATANVTRTAWRRRRWWVKTLALSAAAFLLLKLGVSFLMSDMGIFTFLDLQRQQRELERELVELRTKNLRLSQQVEALKSDPLYIEMLAREQLGMARPGEQVYRFVPSDKP
jgi:cell division protein FtsB